MPAVHWTKEAKELHKELRGVLIEGQDPLPLLKRGCQVFCHDDLLLVTSWLQVKNLVRVLTKLMPYGISKEISTWDDLLECFKTEIEALDVSEEIREFNIVNLRNRRVLEILNDEGHHISSNENGDTWKPKMVAGQTFWLKN